MTIFQIIPLVGLFFGFMYGSEFGSKFGLVFTVVGAIVGGGIGFVSGQVPFILCIKWIQQDLSRKTSSELRVMLHDPECLSPNTLLLELNSRGEDVDQELPVVLELLADSSRDRRRRGWHALESAFPDLANLIPDYCIDDSIENCKKRIAKLLTKNSSD